MIRRENRRGIVWMPVAVTYALLGVVLAWVLKGSAGGAADGVTTDSGGRISLVVIALATVLALFVRNLEIRERKWIAWIPFFSTGGIILALWALVLTGRDALAWSAYGGLQVLRGRVPYADTDWVLRWFDCEFCERWDPHYGPALQWLEPLTGGTLGLAWGPLLAITVLAGLCVSIFVLVRVSPPLGAPVLVVAAVGPAWLLLADRINVDAPILIIAVLGAVLAVRINTLWAWSILALGIWVMGAFKYFPFPMAVGLIPVIFLRRGWIVLGTFLAAAAAYMWWAREEFAESSRWNTEKIIVIEDFPAYGRLQVLDRMAVYDSNPTLVLIASGLLIALTAAAAWWGFTWGLKIDRPSTLPAVLALFGTTAFVGTVLLSGFGFMYKGAFLLLAVPLLANGRRTGGGFVLFTSIIALSLLLISVMVAYSTLLVTLAGLIAAGIAFGAASAVLLRTWKELSPRADSSTAILESTA